MSVSLPASSWSRAFVLSAPDSVGLAINSRSFLDSLVADEGASSCLSDFKSDSTLSSVLASLEAAAVNALEAYLPARHRRRC